MFDVEAQIVRADQIGTKYSGQGGTAVGMAGNVAPSTFNITSGTVTGNVGVAGFTYVSAVSGAQVGAVQYQSTQVASYGPQTGRRMGSLNSFAGTHSFNPAGNFYQVYNTESSDAVTVGAANALVIGASIASTNAAPTNNGEYLGSNYWSYTSSLQQFAPSLYKQLVTTAEQRFNAKIRTIVCPTSLRTHLSDTMPTSRSYQPCKQ